MRATYPDYFMSKQKVALADGVDVDGILKQFLEQYKDEKVNDVDGVKIDFAESWVHLRKSNTEPIIRIYSESSTLQKADELASRIMNDIKQM